MTISIISLFCTFYPLCLRRRRRRSAARPDGRRWASPARGSCPMMWSDHSRRGIAIAFLHGLAVRLAPPPQLGDEHGRAERGGAVGREWLARAVRLPAQCATDLRNSDSMCDEVRAVGHVGRPLRRDQEGQLAPPARFTLSTQGAHRRCQRATRARRRRCGVDAG